MKSKPKPQQRPVIKKIHLYLLEKERPSPLSFLDVLAEGGQNKTSQSKKKPLKNSSQQIKQAHDLMEKAGQLEEKAEKATETEKKERILKEALEMYRKSIRILETFCARYPDDFSLAYTLSEV